MQTNIDSHDRARRIRQTIIEMAASGQGEGGNDTAVLKRFLPLPGHSRILEPECMLIIGHRGAGKTELFRVLKEPGGPEAIAAVSPRVDSDALARTAWCVGYSTGTDRFAHPMPLQRFAGTHGVEDLQLIWLCYLARTLASSAILQPSELPQEMFKAGISLDAILAIMNEHLDAVIATMDRLNRQLEAEDRHVFVTYDELDRVSASSWDALAVIVRGLVQFWSANSRRWRRIRPKIFLRNDLYQKAAIVGPDVSKISANRLRLSWSVKDLYALFFKRLVNQDESAVREYFGETLPQGVVHDALGWLPRVASEDDFRPPLERMCGEYMGANPTKGRTFSWIPAHLQDAHAEVLPRSFIRMFERAAEIEEEHQQARWPHIIHHSSLRGALDRVSADRMEEIKEEFPWIDVLRQHLLPKGIRVPIDRKEFQDHIKIKWENEDEDRRAPFRNSYELIQFLGEFGMFYTRKDGRVDVRDIYLKGLGLKRKGGVQRPF